MAAAEPIVLSSSQTHGFIPTTPPRRAQPTSSSSPGLPSLSKLIGGMFQSPGRRAFTSEQSPIAETGRAGAEESRKQTETSDKPNSRGKSVARSKTKRSADTAVAVSAGDVESGHVGAEKKQLKNPKKDAQTKLKKAKVTKPGSRSSMSKRPEKKFVEDVIGTANGKCETGANIFEIAESPAVYKEAGLGLVEAVKRRRDWSPAKDMSKDIELSNETEGAWSALVPCSPPSAVTNMHEGEFAKRLGEFGFATSAPQAVNLVIPALWNPNSESATKKRKLDLVTGIPSSKSKTIPVKRSRSPKKKPQTITDKATAPFLLGNQASTSTLLDYISGQHQSTGTGKILPSQKRFTISEPGETQQKHPRKTKAAKPKAKKVKELVVLHPPELAVKVANEQDLLFGTSSQLARDESPTFIRDLQRAVKESETDSSHLSSHGNDSQFSAQSIASTLSNSRLPTAERNLWSVAARDDTGHLLDVDVVDLVDTPKAPHCFASKSDSIDSGRGVSVLPAAADSLTAVGLGSCRAVSNHTGAESIHPPGSNHEETENLLPRSVAESSLKERPRNKSPVKKSEPSKDPKATVTERGPLLGMPNYNALNDIELKKAVTATGFKNIRKREDKITHLQKCWDEKQKRRALQSLPQSTSAPPKSADVPEEEVKSSSRRRGRPRKIESAISNTEDAKALNATSSKKPRGRPKKSAAVGSPKLKSRRIPPAAVESSKKDQTLVLDMSETGQVSPIPSSPGRSASLKSSRPRKVIGSSAVAKNAERMAAFFPMITKAVTSYPPRHDIHNLTWFEKMLLYDPIVLEDLTGWLNSEGLSRVGCDETVDPMVVKMWCESQSVCCLWSENLKGGTRPRH
ncbi:MAG: hypothetical protein Q9182_000278 [Xanthomendoza sp. 2 TL-2023]